MLLPLLMCLVLTGILGYLGIHVICRKVIFVDLAMAQVAALGTTYAFALGYDPRDPGDVTGVYLFSLGFTLIGAAIFALTRMRYERVPQEAFIGIVYATATAIAILILSKTPTEAEYLKHMLVGNILLVHHGIILKTAGIYAVIAMVHWVLRDRFFKITLDPEGAVQEGINIRVWDFVFYVTFGFAITSSVAVAGVLLVFSYLVVPSAIAIMFAETIRARIMIAWAAGTIVSILGMTLSYYGDLPTGPSVVTCFAIVLVAAGIGRFLRSSTRPLLAVGKVSGVLLVIGCVFYGSTLLKKAEQDHRHPAGFESLLEALKSGQESEQIDAVHHLAELADPHAVPHLLEVLKGNPSERLIEHIVQALPLFSDRSAVEVLKGLGQRDFDAFLKIEIANAILRLRDPSGIPILLDVLKEEKALLPRVQAFQLFRDVVGKDFGYDPYADEKTRDKALKSMKVWWDRVSSKIRWREQKGRFE